MRRTEAFAAARLRASLFYFSLLTALIDVQYISRYVT